VGTAHVWGQRTCGDGARVGTAHVWGRAPPPVHAEHKLGSFVCPRPIFSVFQCRVPLTRVISRRLSSERPPGREGSMQWIC